MTPAPTGINFSHDMNTTTQTAPTATKPALTPEEKKAKLDQLIIDLAGDLKPEVDKIEASPMTTQNHYGNYGALLTTVSGGNQNTANLIALALIKAGANEQGVKSAMAVFF